MKIQFSRYKKKSGELAVFLARHPLALMAALLLVILASFGLFFYQRFLFYQKVNATSEDPVLEFRKDAFQSVIWQLQKDEALRASAPSLSPKDLFH